MNDQSIAWMIAGGQTETPEERRMRAHRLALAESTPSRPARWSILRQRFAAAVASPATDLRERSAIYAVKLLGRLTGHIK